MVSFQYRIGESGDPKAFLKEISWAATSPDNSNYINERFLKQHRSLSGKAAHISEVTGSSGSQSQHRYDLNLVRICQGHKEQFMENQHPVTSTTSINNTILVETPSIASSRKKKDKREQLLKAQKCKLADKTDHKGKLP